MAARLPLVDAVKVLATQLIVWHHLAFYGPMSDVVYPYAPGLLSWLYDHGRLAVQVFLVVGGFLAARSLWPRLAPQGGAPAARLPLLPQVWKRYVRLVRPFAAALLVALLSAALARGLMDHEATPAAPSLAQLAAHLLLLHDVLGFDGLSAGVWYVAIDFQLFVLLLSLAWLAQAWAPALRCAPAHLATALAAGLAVASLAWINLQPGWDVWAPYFFGAYGLGVLAAQIARLPHPRRLGPGLVLVTLVALALCWQWRSRVAVAGVTALVLAWGTGAPLRQAAHGLWRWLDGRLVAPLARISYAQFLMHYPVGLLINALVTHHWPGHAGINALGMFYAWGLSLAAATLFHRHVEQGQLPERALAWLGRLLLPARRPANQA